jgi:DNA-binding winged helix-turn-helix (wHTH) protein
LILIKGEDRYQLDFGGHYLWRIQGRGREEKHLTPKAWSVLQYLAERHRALVRKEELLKAVWGEDTNVTEASLSRIVRELRAAFDDNPENAAFIETVHGDGYRFIAEEESHSSAKTEHTQAAEGETSAGLGTPQDGLDFGRLIKIAAESGASAIVDRLGSGMKESIALHSDRVRALRFLRYYLEGELEDTQEWLASSSGEAEKQKEKKKDTTGEIAAGAFMGIFYARELGDARKKQRALTAMLREVDSMASGPKSPEEIIEELTLIARLYLK